MNLRQKTASFAVCAGLMALLAAPSAIGAVVLASDNFDSYTTGAVNGQNGGTGWAGAWVDPTPTNANVVVTNGSDSPMSGNAMRVTGLATEAAKRTLATAVSGNVIVKFDFQFDAGTIDNNDFLGLWFGNSTGPNIGLKANCGGTANCTADIFARTTGTSGSFFQNIVVGTTYSIMGYLQKTSGNFYDRFDLWVDPTASEMNSLTGFDASFTGATTMSSFSQIGFRTATLTGNDALLIDNLSLSRVPEPGVLGLLGLGLAGLAMTRRRKSF